MAAERWLPYLLPLLYLIVGIRSEYFGRKLGSLKNTTFGLLGDVFLVNETTLQITDFHLRPAEERLELSFFFSTDTDTAKGVEVYQVFSEPHGGYSKPIAHNLDEGFEGARLVINVPGRDSKTWTYFGVVAEDKWFYLSAVPLKAEPPRSLCCITDPAQPSKGIAGFYYNVQVGPITVLDSKTLLLPHFRFEGTKPPDGWIYAGKGRVSKTTGKKAFVVGRDSRNHHCAIHEDFDGTRDLVIRLADEQTVYDINYLSVYCFDVGVDFGHVPVQLDPKENLVPAYIPPVRDSPPREVEMEKWDRPVVVMIPQVGRPIDLVFALGPGGGIRARAMRGTCDNLDQVWYVQGQIAPEIWVQRGIIYRLKALGGSKHPLYITNEPEGGFAKKTFDLQRNIVNFIGGKGEVVGSDCSYIPLGDSRASEVDMFTTFEDYSAFLAEKCAHPFRPAEVLWTVNDSVPAVVYYQSYSTPDMGGPIRVCTRISGSTAKPECED